MKNKIIKEFSKAIKPRAKMTVSEWADNYRILDSTSAESGKYRTSRTPYLREIMDCLSEHSLIDNVIFMKSAQIGGSEAGNNWIGYCVDYNPSSLMIVQPTVALAEKYSKSRINTMIDLCPTLKSLFNNNKKSNTVLNKTYKGGMINFVGANSAASLRSVPVKNLMLDETDAYPNDVEGEGDPIDLAKKRTSTFSRSKTFEISTPTIEKFSKIHKSFLKGDQCYYNVPCPHCGGFQKLVFNQLKFEYDKETRIVKKDSVFYQCIFCDKKILEHHKTEMFNRGKWIAENKNAPENIRSFHISALYSPAGWKMSWHNVAQEFLYCKHDQFKYKTFINTILGEVYKEKTEQPSYQKIIDRADEYDINTNILPHESIISIFGGVDVQDDRLCYLALGVGQEQELWVLEYEEILGSPAEQSTWQQLLNKSNKKYIHKAGVELTVKKIAIDTGGHFTDYVYDFCRINQKFLAIKGASHSMHGYFKNGNEIDKNKDGVSFDNSIKLFLINTNLTKKTIYQFLNNVNQGPKYIHTSKNFDESFYKMLTAEVIVKKIINGNYVERFEKPTSSTRNEVLDCISYAYVMARMHGAHDLYEASYKKAFEEIITKKINKKIFQENQKKENEEQKDLNLIVNQEIQKKEKELLKNRFKKENKKNNFFNSNL